MQGETTAGTTADDAGTCRECCGVTVAIGDGPWGPFRVAARADGVVALELVSTADSFEAGLARRRLGPPVPLESHLAPCAAASLCARTRDLVAGALRGEHAGLHTLPVDLSDRSAWDQMVLGAVRAIPWGETASYGEVARRIGRTGAARAVGGAVGRNPVGLLIPCHRVIAGDGSLGGYGVVAFGGREAALAVKRELLALEGVTEPTPRR
jgi:methylated-DNA-[protein]-cysteine S-methyltransferase